jgi:hypothetical protein
MLPLALTGYGAPDDAHLLNRSIRISSRGCWHVQ